MKKLIVLLLSLPMILIAIPANSNTDEKVIAIIDTYVDSSKFNNIIHEVCITTNKSCLNNDNFMEGKNAANVLPTDLTAKDIEHGHEMARIATMANESTKIVFIRIANINRWPNFNAIHRSDLHLALALKWINENYSKYSIDAVSISQARINFPQGTCPINIEMSSYINNLYNNNVLTFAGVGNWRRHNHTAFPACLDNVIGIGATDLRKNVYHFSHTGIGVDFYGLGRIMVDDKAVLGTSVATPHVASIWINKFKGSPSEQYEQASNSAFIYTDSRLNRSYNTIER